MPQVLIIAYYFPPIGGIGSIRAASFAKYLPEFGWDPTVLAPADTPHPSDLSLDVGQTPVVRTRSLELSRLGRPAIRQDNEEQVGPYQAGMRSGRSLWLRRVAKQVIFPDPQIGWYPSAVAGGTRLLRGGTFDLIFSSAFPITSHLVAWTLKRRSGVPWVAEFRDPWSDDPDFRLVSTAARRVERMIASKAHAVVLPTPTWAEYYAHRWGVKPKVIGHGSDVAVRRPVSRPDPPVLAHIGTYWPGRQNLETLWSALAEMRRRGCDIPRLTCAGAFPEDGRAELDRYGLGDILDLAGFVSQPDALSLMSSSSALISCDFVDTDPLSRGWIPAKLPEYLASGLPIIHIGHPAGEAALMLSRHPGCYTVAFGDVEGAITAIRAAVADEVQQRDASALSRRARTAELAELFDTIVSRDS